MILHWTMVSLLIKILDIALCIFVYEVIRHLVINKVKEIGLKIKNAFTRKK